jgi:cytochrome b6-f complex iron-sulfur subunit
MTKLSRSDFLKLGTNFLLGLGGALGLGGLVRFLSYEMDPSPPDHYDLGSVDDYPHGSRIVFLQIPAVLIHNDDGFLALSLVCTHLGCTVESQDGEYECPCHGSKYDSKGYVTRGPSNTPLKKLRVEVNETGNVILYMEQI